jgi:hypothetical protein
MKNLFSHFLLGVLSGTIGTAFIFLLMFFPHGSPNMKKYTGEELKNVVYKHKEWLLGHDKGQRADLSDSDLTGVNLSGANLDGANLHGVEGY